jgi:hypothetical protein
MVRQPEQFRIVDERPLEKPLCPLKHGIRILFQSSNTRVSHTVGGYYHPSNEFFEI